MKLSRYKSPSPVSYTLGATLSYELFRTHPDSITRVFLRPNLTTDHLGTDLQQLLDAIRKTHIEIIESDKPFNVLDAKDSCLLIAEFTKFNQPLDANAPHLILVNPADAGNLGTIMRSAAGFNYQNLAIITPAVDHFAPKTLRASMGAFTHLNIQTFDSIDAYRRSFPEHQLYAFMLREAKPLPEVVATDIPSLHSLVFGNEAAGLPNDYANFCQPVFIPQTNNIDSLNLSVAASIALYEFSKH